MREVVLDTETTGIDAANDRIIEIGCVELMNHMPTGRVWHAYLDPKMPVSEGAFAVHGLSNEFLAGKPVFADVADDFLAFVDDAMLVIHNASFDTGFLNAELKRTGRASLDPGAIIDTLGMARRKHPGAANSLDALCLRYGIDNSRRTRHGALLDAEILAEVYVELIGGRQAGLAFEPSAFARRKARPAAAQRPVPLAPRITPDEIAAHERFIETLGAAAIWRQYRSAPAKDAEP